MTPSMQKALFVSVLIALAAPAPAQPPTDAQRSAIRSACRGDYANVCANVPTGGKEALQCLQQHQSEVSTKCQAALAPLAPPTAAPTTAAPTTAAAAAAPLPSEQPPASPATTTSAQPQMSRRQEMHLLRTDCGADFQKFCGDVQLGGGRGLACLREHQTQLTSLCQSALLLAGSAKQ
jgi:hypothetical protein